MNSIRSSNLGGLACCLLLVLAVTGLVAATAGTALAFDDSAEGLAEEYQVGSDAAVTYTISDPFTDVSNQYTLQGETGLTDVSWTVTVYRAGDQVSQNTYGGENFSQAMDIENDGDEIHVRVEGTTPEVGNYTYPDEEQFLLANLTRVSGENPTTFRTDRVHHYTGESKDARDAIESAQAAIDEAGGHEEAESSLGNAISAYENENFQLAQDLGGEAQDQVEQARSSAQTMQLVLMAVGALVVIGLLVGGVLYWRSQQDEYTKL